MRKRPPYNYRELPEVREAYEEGGRSLGRAILWDPSKEEYFWNLLKGCDLWPRWYLAAFKGLYSDENPLERKRSIKNRYQQKLAKRRKLDTLEEIREQAARRLTAHPEPNDPELLQDGG